MSIHCRIFPSWQTTRDGKCNRTDCKSRNKEGCAIMIYKLKKSEVSCLMQKRNVKQLHRRK